MNGNKQKKKKILLTPKVENFFFFILNPFGFAPFTYGIICAVLYAFVDHEIIFWSWERSSLQLQAVGITFVLLPLLGASLHYVAKVIDRWRNADHKKLSQQNIQYERISKPSVFTGLIRKVPKVIESKEKDEFAKPIKKSLKRYLKKQWDKIDAKVDNGE